MYNTVIVILILAFSGCGSKGMSSKEEIVEVKLNEFVKERRYYDRNKNLVGIVHFKTDKSKQERTPLDSVRYDVSPTGQLLKVKYFNNARGKYEADANSPMQNYYEVLINNISECSEIKGITNAYLLLEASNDICIIAGSLLSDGKEASSLRKQTNDSSLEGTKKTITYDSLNSKFIGLSEELQSQFYHQPLKTLVITIRSNLLNKEDYYFSEGRATREYIYKKRKLLFSIITVRRNDGETKKIVKEYSYQ